MGKVILCTGKKAKHPYTFYSTGIRVYTVEELCYYIYHNVDTVGEDLLRSELVTFFKDELGLSDRGSLIEELLERHAGIKEIVVCILCSSDYFVEKDVLYVLNELEKLDNLTSAGRRKRHGDYCLRHGLLREAYNEYQSIILQREYIDMTDDEYAGILHNMALVQVRNGLFVQAAEGFLEAYECNKNKESLKHYMYALKLSKQEDTYNKALQTIKADRIFVEELENELYYVSEGEEKSRDYLEVQRIKQLFQEGRVSEYEQMIDDMIERLKNIYRLSS